MEDKKRVSSIDRHTASEISTADEVVAAIMIGSEEFWTSSKTPSRFSFTLETFKTGIFPPHVSIFVH
jgi:hypothetical protein